MATKKSSKTNTSVEIKDEDNPSLVKVGGKLCLRVFEDFFVEKELPKWKKFEERKNALLKEIDTSALSNSSRVSSYIGEKRRTDPALAKDIEAQVKMLNEMSKVLEDDKWGIQEKHEKEVNAALAKMSVFYRFTPTTLRGKIAKWFDGFKKKPELVPVEIAFKDLKDHMEMATSSDVMQAKTMLEGLVTGFERSGQYEKAKSARNLIPQLAHELAIADLGFTKYVSEQQMIDFIRKSERGVMINFLRYYEGNIPEDVVAKKNDADSRMIFDNYVIAYFGDFEKESKKAQAREKEVKKATATASRRDPILFGMIKQTRKLYYICDWVTPEDDLTLEKLEKVLGESANRLFRVNGPRDENETALLSTTGSERAVLSNVNSNSYRSFTANIDEWDSMNYTLPRRIYQLEDAVFGYDDTSRVRSRR